MINRNYFFTALLSFCVIGIAPVNAQDKDVDQADSLDFEAFHTDKKAAIKVWKDSSKDAPVKAYEQSPTDTASTPVGPEPASANTAAPAAAAVAAGTSPKPSTGANSAAASTTVAKPATAATKAGQRYEIRERYTLTRSTKTPYSAFYVIEPLYKQAAQLCSHGWKKLTERSEPIEQDFYLYYEIECL